MIKRNKPYGAFFFFIGIACLSLAVIAFHKPEKYGAGTGDSARDCLYVVCSTGIIADMVTAMGGERVQVDYLMGPGVDPHIYRARASDMQRLASADLIFYHGLHLEGKMATLFERMDSEKRNTGNISKVGEIGKTSSVMTVAVADAIPKELLCSADGESVGEMCLYDPHVWHDVSLWHYAAHRVEQVLIQADPAHAHEYQERAQKYFEQLHALDAYIRKQVAKIPEQQRILITAHDAFSYFGSAYGFHVVGLQGISTDSEISMHDIQRVADTIITHAVPALFVESLIPERTLEAVRQAVRARGQSVAFGAELFSDALGDAAVGADTYCGMMRHNVDAIVAALGGG